MILFKDRVAADFLVRSMEFHNIGLGRSWDFLVGTVWLHLFLCLHEYILTGKLRQCSTTGQTLKSEYSVLS